MHALSRYRGFRSHGAGRIASLRCALAWTCHRAADWIGRLTAPAIGLLALIVLVVALSGCAGQQTRDRVLLPAMQDTWPGVRADAEAGGADAGLLDEFGEALEAGDTATVQMAWPRVREAAEAGIEGQDLGEGVKESLRERLRQFDQAVEKLRTNHGPEARNEDVARGHAERVRPVARSGSRGRVGIRSPARRTPRDDHGPAGLRACAARGA